MSLYAFSHLAPAQRTILEDKIAQNRREYAEITRRINASASIMRIPEEILVEIMKDYIEAWRADVWPYDRLRDFDGGPSFFGWTRITHVCSYWREIALGAPRLWTRIKPVSAASIETFITRSKELPLQIEGALFREYFKRPNFIKNWRRVFAESARIESINVVSDYSNFDDEPDIPLELEQQDSPFVPEYTERLEFLTFGRPQFPNLRRLQICVLEADAHLHPLPPFIHYAGVLPSLEFLQTNGIPLRDVAPHLPATMKHLSVRGSLSNALTLGRILDILAAMPHLVTLSLDIYARGITSIGEIDLSDSVNHPAVNLSNLQSLTLKSPSCDMAHFLSKVVLPPDTPLHLSTYLSSRQGEVAESALAQLRSAVASHLFQPSSRPIRALQIRNRALPGGGSPKTTLTAWNTPSDLSSTGKTCVMHPAEGDEEKPEEDAMVSIELRGYKAETVFCFLVADLPLSEVETIAARGRLVDDGGDAPPSSQSDVWCKVFAQMQAVRTICAGGRFVQSLADALLPAGPLPITLFPVLETVCLHAPKDLEVEQHKEGWLAALERSLKERRELEAPLRSITICGLSFGEEEVPRLGQVVGKVNWVEGEESDSEPEEGGIVFGGFFVDDLDEDF